MKINQVCVVIPVYKSRLDSLEHVALTSCIRVLNNYTIVIATYKDLDTSIYKNLGIEKFEYFDKFYFDGIIGYNRLMLSEKFYYRFQDYNYILISQLDAFLFNDKLVYWINKDYDYVGAPRINWSFFSANYWRDFKKHFHFVFAEAFYFNLQKVRNGGFSLRKVSKFIKVLEVVEPSIFNRFYNNGFKNKPYREEFNEDVFWSLASDFTKIKFRVTPAQKAKFFSIEGCPDLKKIDFNKQFGIHGWTKQSCCAEWIQVLRKFKMID